MVVELPARLKAAVENQAEGVDRRRMGTLAEGLRARYRAESGCGKRLLTSGEEAVVYAIVRMPATYGAVYTALGYALGATGFQPRSLLDVGAGTGTAAWAADALLDLDRVTLIEREDAMLAAGRELMRGGSDALAQAEWVRADLAKDAIERKADLVTASYVLNELSEVDRARAVDKLWEATLGMLLIVEPGTPEGYRQLLAARERLIKMGAHIAAPCPHGMACPLAAGDWCHFYCRIARGRLHKQLKDGDMPYEDEKFSYMAFARFACERAGARILRSPRIEKGRIALDLCGAGGTERRTVFKRDAEAYKRARKADWGEWAEFLEITDDGIREVHTE